MKEDRHEESEARREQEEDSAVAVVVATEKAEDEAHDGAGDEERFPRWSPNDAPAAAAAPFAENVPGLAAATIGSSGGVSGTGGKALLLPLTADCPRPDCQAGGVTSHVFPPPLWFLLLPL